MDYKHNSALVPYARRLRREMTKEERRLWYEYLRTYPVRFTRQKGLGAYIVDFYCSRAKLAIELDGSQHYEAPGMANDASRTRYLQGFGIEVLRIPNNEVAGNFPGVCEYIDRAVKRALKL